MADSTNIGPLTTTFLPDPTCIPQNNVWYIFPNVGGFYWQYGPPPASNCFPSRYKPESTAYYSPGRCPAYYTSADTSTITSGSVTETVVTCCPSGPILSANRDHEDLYSDYPNLSSMACTWNFDQDMSWPTMTRSSAGKTTVSSATWVSGSGGVQAYGVVVRYQSSDVLTGQSTVATSTQPPPTSLSTATSSPTSAPASTTIPPSTKSEGLSTGAKAGIGAGVTAGLLAILLTAALTYIFTKRRKEKAPTPVETDDSPVLFSKPEMLAVSPVEAPGDHLHQILPELYGHPRPPQELAAEESR
ncbi:hypothetical protein BDV96DRAFT_644244 [Lophiotrema nucula]|uniref:Uncharacterized protein n=1 Tax=Lophiotrema nucula TaxID=690887 RepID=A0A6A5ZGM8_9PLEO|nr:hypothetical protein BDV96DRAFT_644244 [Lophiotrema nucula]